MMDDRIGGIGKVGSAFLPMLLALLLLVPNQVFGQDGNQLIFFRVSGVAASDVLNIRKDADSASAIVGSFAPGAGPIEVFRRQHNWGEVATPEGTGWVNMRFLVPMQVASFGNSPLPNGLTCAGTEPFWSVHLDQGKAMLSTPQEANQKFSVVSTGGFIGRAGPDGFFVANGSQSQLTGIVSFRQCGDGMSERRYGWWINLLITDANGSGAVTGCCSLSAH